jgi:hypothetical protein
MTEITFLEEKTMAPASKEQMDSFIQTLEEAGIVQTDVPEQEQIKPTAKMKEENIGIWEFQYGTHEEHYVVSFWPFHHSRNISTKIDHKKGNVVMAIIQTLQTVVPDTMQVKISMPIEDLELRVFTVKVLGAAASFTFDCSLITETIPKLADAVTKAII